MAIVAARRTHAACGGGGAATATVALVTGIGTLCATGATLPNPEEEGISSFSLVRVKKIRHVQVPLLRTTRLPGGPPASGAL